MDGFRFPEQKTSTRFLGLQPICPTTWYYGNGPRFALKLFLLLQTRVVSDFLTFLTMIEVTMKWQAACALRQEPFGRAPSRCVAFGMASGFICDRCGGSKEDNQLTQWKPKWVSIENIENITIDFLHQLFAKRFWVSGCLDV